MQGLIFQVAAEFAFADMNKDKTYAVLHASIKGKRS